MSESPLILELPQWTLIAFYLAVAGGALYCAHKKLTAARAMMMTIALLSRCSALFLKATP